MWLRDSTAAGVGPTSRLMKTIPPSAVDCRGESTAKRAAFPEGPLRETPSTKTRKKEASGRSDRTDMKPGVHERKWEIVPSAIRSAWLTITGRLPRRAAPSMPHGGTRILRNVQTFGKATQDPGRDLIASNAAPRSRRTPWLAAGMAGRQTGGPDSASMFRPSDDSTFSLTLVPFEFSLRWSVCARPRNYCKQIHHDQESATQCRALADEVERACANMLS